MQHQLDRIIWPVLGVSLGPFVPDGICKDGAVAIERRRGDCATAGGESPKPLVGDPVPEVKGAIGARCAESGGVYGVEIDISDGPDLDDFLGVRRVTMAPEGEVDVVDA